MSISSLEKLLGIASPPLVAGPALLSMQPVSCEARLVNDLLQILDKKNGFYCFENALHVFPSRSKASYLGLDAWNSADLWRDEYAGLDRDIFFFAEDVFGNQFGLIDNFICTFNAETAEVKEFSRSAEDWARCILSDYSLHTGYPLAHQWQTQSGALTAGYRLVPKVPFVLGGEFSIKNLYACKAVAGMKARGNLARQLVNVPDGTTIQYSIAD